MPTPTKGSRLGGSPAHERLMLANLATSLFQHGKIRTTETKAKRLRPLAEQLITKAKRGDLHARRQVLTVVRDKDVVFTLFDQIAPRFATRPGGYTRIVKLGPRKGDAAPMAMIELVEELVVAAPSQPAKASKATRSTARKAAKAQTLAALAREDEDAVPPAGGDTESTRESEDTVSEPVAEASQSPDETGETTSGAAESMPSSATDSGAASASGDKDAPGPGTQAEGDDTDEAKG